LTTEIVPLIREPTKTKLMKRQLVFFAGITLGLLLPNLLRSQEIGLLRINPEASRGEATLWGGIEEGWFRPSFAATFQWTAGAGANGVHHGKKTSWSGNISIEQAVGKEMFSSVFLEPGYFPMDILEFNLGTKSRQTGLLEGGVLTDLNSEWQLGAKASFKAANSSKKDDLRHSTLGMQMMVEPVVTFKTDDDAGYTVSYPVRLRTERAKADPATENTKQIFLDEGLRYGSFMDNLGIFQIRELSHGFNALYYSPEFSFGGGIIWKRGQAGESDYGTYRFPGSTLNVRLERMLEGFTTLHTYGISYRRLRDQLRSVIDADSFNALSDRVNRTLGLKYEVRFLDGALKNIGIDLTGNYWNERATPTADFTDITTRYDGTVALHTALSFGPVDLRINASAGQGWWQDRGRYGLGEETEDQPFRLTGDWLRKMEYLMVPRTGLGGTLVCRIPSVKGLYCQIDAHWTHAFQIELLGGRNRETATLKVGYRF